MLTRLLVLAVFAVSAVPSADSAEPERVVAVDASDIRGASPIEFIADGIPHQQLVSIQASRNNPPARRGGAGR